MAIFGLTTRKEMQAQIAEAVKAALASEFPRWLLQTAEAEQFSTDEMSAYEAQARTYQKLSWVTSACTITAQAAALARFDVKRVISDKEPKDIPNHPFEQLLRRPNPLDSRFEFLMATVLFWMLNGNAYWWLNRSSENDAPEEIWFLPPHMVKPWPDGNMFLKGYYYYPGNGAEILLPPHEIVHFRRPNPFSRFLGMSAIESLAFAIKGDLAMQGWNTKLYDENNARLPSVMTFADMVNDTTWDKMKGDIREASKKREMMMLRGVGAGGVQWLQNAMSQKDMAFIESRAFNRDEIWNTLAPGLVSMLSENATEANSRTGKATFNELTVYPLHVMMSEKITNGILPAYGGRPLVGGFEDVRVTDKNMELAEIERYTETHTIAEIREKYYGDDPLGDERDDLLPKQVNATSGGIQEPPLPKVLPGQPGQPGKPAQTPENQQKATEDKQDAPKQKEPAQKADSHTPTPEQQAAISDLNAWQRVAVKRVGKATDFDTNAIPTEIIRYVNEYLPGQKSMAAVKSVFDNARRMVGPKKEQPKPEQAPTDLAALARSLDNLAAISMKAQPAAITPEIIREIVSQSFKAQAVQPQTINVNTPEQRFTFETPTQPAPQNNITFAPVVEAAPIPAVYVDHHTHNTIEPAAAPVTNLTIENNMEQPAVTFKADVIVPEQPAAVVNVSVEPTPIENKIEVKTPKLKSSKTREDVERDGGDISGKTGTTTFEYEE